MSRNYNGRRTFVRRDAGRAILRFLIGEVVLVVVCSAVYLFVLQGKVNFNFTPKPTQTETTAGLDLATSDPTPPPMSTTQPSEAPTSVPTIEPTAQPTETPTPAPTSTPIPEDCLAGAPETVQEALKAAHNADLKVGLRELRLFDEAGQNVIVVRGYAYIEGADAAQSQSALMLADAFTGELKGMYGLDADSEGADLSFEESAGSHLDQAFFRLNIDASALENGTYLLCVAVENGNKKMWNYLDSSIFHFSVSDGQAALVE